MASPLGSEALTVLLPHADREHPLVGHAFAALPGLSSVQRAAVLDALLVGPFAAGPLPAPVVDAAVADDCEYRRSQRIATVIDRYGPAEQLPAALAAAAWSAGDATLRKRLLHHPGIDAAARSGWLLEAAERDLAALLGSDADTGTVRVVLEEVVRRSPPTLSEYDSTRVATPALPERLLTGGPVAPAAFLPLLVLLPCEPDYRMADAGDRLRKTWADLVILVLRAQPRLAVELICQFDLGMREWDGGSELAMAAGPDERRWSAAERDRWWRTSRLHLWHVSRGANLARLLDVLDDDSLGAIVTHSLRRASEAAAQADLLASWTPRIDPDTAFHQWLALPGVQRSDDDESREVFLSVVFTDAVADLQATQDATRSSVIRPLNSLEPLLRDVPVPVPRIRGLAEGAEAFRSGWSSSADARAPLQAVTARAVAALVLPHPPEGWAGAAWARLVVAAWPLLTRPDAEALPPGSAKRIYAWARARAAEAYRLGYGHLGMSAVNELVKLTAPPPTVSPRPTAAGVLATLREVRGEARFAPPDAVDEALAQVPAAMDLRVDDILAWCEDPTATLTRMAGRLPEIVRSVTSGTTTKGTPPRLRATAAKAVLDSQYMTAAALLELPAFAVFGEQAEMSDAARNRAGRSTQTGTPVGRLLIEMVGGAPAVWERLASDDVANRGPQAWRSLRDVLADAGVVIPHAG